ncbi:hypothetical protein PG994_007384 [Apiospora phragmitis]|uniref:Uncharacterized protein n=1 Tax=Apiospora phragmitis TaxID=2905665 RepID=A0ABR1V341_9PEZI
MQFTTVASMIAVMAVAACVQASPIAGAMDADGARSLLIAREPKCQVIPEYVFPSSSSLKLESIHFIEVLAG